MYDNEKGIFVEKIKEFVAKGDEKLLTLKTEKIISLSSWPNIVIVSYVPSTTNTQTIVRGYESV